MIQYYWILQLSTVSGKEALIVLSLGTNDLDEPVTEMEKKKKGNPGASPELQIEKLVSVWIFSIREQMPIGDFFCLFVLY